MAYYRYTNSGNYYRPSFFGGFQFFPPVIKYLMLSNVAVFILTELLSGMRFAGGTVGEVIMSNLALMPLHNGFQIWQLFTYMFMHGGLMHLVMNMLPLWMFGMELENSWGAKKFLLYYVICGVGAGLSNLFIGPLFSAAAPTVGASGAIFGVLLAFGMLYPDRPVFMYFLVPIRARYFVMLYIVMELFALRGPEDGIAHFAHLGGAAVGFIYLMIDQKNLFGRQLWRRAQQRFTKPEYAEQHSAYPHEEVSDAKYYDVHRANDSTRQEENRINQQHIDEILDKISQNGYQSLTEEEKRILFEASKKLN